MGNNYSISFVLPMFNESANIGDAVRQLKDLGSQLADDYEIVIVDDASTDDSALIVKKIASSDEKIKFFALEKNTMFGGAFAKGFKNASKDIIVYMDSDMPVEENDIRESLPFITDNDIVTGYSRVKKGDTVKRKIISGTYNLIVRSLFGLNVRDINSGYKIVRKRVVDGMNFVSHSPFVDVELFIHARKNGYKVHQFPLVFRTRTGGKSYIARLPIILATFADMFKVKKLLLKNKL